jgi:hypothetical protein
MLADCFLIATIVFNLSSVLLHICTTVLDTAKVRVR